MVEALTVHHIPRPRLYLSHLCPSTHLLHPCPPTHILHPCPFTHLLRYPAPTHIFHLHFTPSTSPPYFSPQPLSYAGTAHQGCHTYYPASPSSSVSTVIKVGLHHSTPPQLPLCSQLLLFLYTLLSLLLYNTPLIRLYPSLPPLRAVHSSLHTGHPCSYS